MPPRRTLTGRIPKQRGNPFLEHDSFAPDGTILCFCDEHPRLKARLRTCQTDRNGNLGRQFWSCANPNEYCDFFIWHDELADKGYHGPALLHGDNDGNRPHLYRGRDAECGADWYDDECYDGGEVDQLRTPPGSNRNSPQKKQKGGGNGNGGGNKKANSSSKKRAVDEDDDDDNDLQVVGSSSKSGEKDKSQTEQKKPKKKKKAIRAAFRTPSPDLSLTLSPSSPSARHLQSELARLRRELDRAKAKEVKLERELNEYRDENSQMLKKLYPEAFSNNVNGNAGRWFWKCKHPYLDCGFFAWEDEVHPGFLPFAGVGRVLGGRDEGIGGGEYYHPGDPDYRYGHDEDPQRYRRRGDRGEGQGRRFGGQNGNANDRGQRSEHGRIDVQFHAPVVINFNELAAEAGAPPRRQVNHAEVADNEGDEEVQIIAPGRWRAAKAGREIANALLDEQHTEAAVAQILDDLFSWVH
ncbi:hypothetical protein JCM3774_005270 [Rhodotorula dairenensis]